MEVNDINTDDVLNIQEVVVQADNIQDLVEGNNEESGKDTGSMLKEGQILSGNTGSIEVPTRKEDEGGSEGKDESERKGEKTKEECQVELHQKKAIGILNNFERK